MIGNIVKKKIHGGPQGWYEVCDYSPDYSYFTIDDKVTAWMKLPKAYEPRVKAFGAFL